MPDTYAPLVFHTCPDHPDGHAAPIAPERNVPLGCGCTRHEGWTCGRAVWWMEPACGRHEGEGL